MIRRGLRALLAALGYEVHRKGTGAGWSERPFSLHQYLRADGTFDYEAYRRIQNLGNLRKLDRVWAIEENIEFLSTYLRRMLGTVEFGICHGTRRGLEQAWFRKYLNCEVIGTEIAETASNFPHTIQWDFHRSKQEWIDAVDFIYSNSFDHSYAPEQCLNEWMRCVKRGGLCILEHSSQHEARFVTELDPFKADLVVMPYLVAAWGRGRYGVRELLDGPSKQEGVDFVKFIVVQRF